MRRHLALAALAAAAPPLAAQDTTASWRLAVTPFAGRADHGHLVDHRASLRQASPFEPGAELVYGERTRLGLDAGRARGVRLDARLGAPAVVNGAPSYRDEVQPPRAEHVYSSMLSVGLAFRQ